MVYYLLVSLFVLSLFFVCTLFFAAGLLSSGGLHPFSVFPLAPLEESLIYYEVLNDTR